MSADNWTRLAGILALAVGVADAGFLHSWGHDFDTAMVTGGLSLLVGHTIGFVTGGRSG